MAPIPETRFPRTKRAIHTIKDESLRRDFADLLAGVEYGLSEHKVELSNDCIERLRVLAHSLCRTIGGEAAVGVIQGLNEDAAEVGESSLQIPNWGRGRRCDTTGSRSCVSAQNSSCHGDSTGCISTSGGVPAAAYVWGVTLL